MDFAYIFGWDIDFIFDVRKGDKFAVIFEAADGPVFVEAAAPASFFQTELAITFDAFVQ